MAEELHIQAEEHTDNRNHNHRCRMLADKRLTECQMRLLCTRKLLTGEEDTHLKLPTVRLGYKVRSLMVL
jgi:hypothetical protein